MLWSFVALLSIFLATDTAAEPPRTVVAKSAIDGDTLALTDGVALRLVGMMAPKTVPPGASGLRALADAARAALDELAAGQTLALTYTGSSQDRHGRLLAHAHDRQGRWIQGELLAAGFARVITAPDNRAFSADMLRLEGEARARGLGLWANPQFRVLTADEAIGYVDSFQIVEGAVLSVASVRDRVYINFGPDWRTDFTIALGRRTFRAIASGDTDSLIGRRLRVRGWLKLLNGPLIEVSHSEQVELTEP
jgi:endonuclease YncB( thermonuclease family)